MDGNYLDMFHSGIGVRYATDLWRTASSSFLRRRISSCSKNGWRKIWRKKSQNCTPKMVGVKFQNAKERRMHFLLFVLVIPIEAQYQRGRLNKDLRLSICLKICVASAEDYTNLDLF